MNPDRESLIFDNLALVGFVINKNLTERQIRYFGYEDLFQTGCIGLIKASMKYTDSKGAFSTFAFMCIQNEILMYLRKESRPDIYLTIDDFIDESEVFESVYAGDIIYSIVRNDIECVILGMIAQGYSYKDIRLDLNMSYIEFSKSIKRLKYRTERNKIFKELKY